VTLPSVEAVSAAAFPSITARVESIDRAVTEGRGHEALGDAVWRDLARPGDGSIGLFADDIAYAHVARSDTFAPQHWIVGLAARPDADPDPRPALLEAASEHVARHGGGRVVAWVFAAGPTDDDVLAQADFAPARDLLEMRAPLPAVGAVEWPPGITVRDFEPGLDDEAWLVVNNRAFENHPEQGAWVAETLRRRMAEPWFDPSLFVLAFDDDGLAGSNWCKVHPATEQEPALGEIFVIGIDPRMTGRGLGRPLALEGLARMHARGITTGQLFTNADNTRAIALYESIGFSVHRVDRSYAREVDVR
jgi:mycothiol synthase